MPIYSYVCDNCSEQFEKIVSMKERETDHCCPACGAETVRRTVGRTSFKLNGKGWYKDGYQGGGPIETD